MDTILHTCITVALWSWCSVLDKTNVCNDIYCQHQQPEETGGGKSENDEGRIVAEDGMFIMQLCKSFYNTLIDQSKLSQTENPEVTKGETSPAEEPEGSQEVGDNDSIHEQTEEVDQNDKVSCNVILISYQMSLVNITL